MFVFDEQVKHVEQNTNMFKLFDLQKFNVTSSCTHVLMTSLNKACQSTAENAFMKLLAL